jgi:hypothetical protein
MFAAPKISASPDESTFTILAIVEERNFDSGSG